MAFTGISDMREIVRNITKFNTDYLAVPIICVYTHSYTLLNKFTRMRVPIDAAPLVPAGTGGAAVASVPVADSMHHYKH